MSAWGCVRRNATRTIHDALASGITYLCDEPPGDPVRGARRVLRQRRNDGRGGVAGVVVVVMKELDDGVRVFGGATAAATRKHGVENAA